MLRNPRFALLLTLVILTGAPGVNVKTGARQPTLQSMADQALARIEGNLTVAGLQAPVRVIRDRWGVPHIYAASSGDLFFAQGYVMAQDRLWQMEMWRRTSEGRLSEILGPDAFPRDRMARMLKYRGPMDDTEWTSYHPQARALMTAYVNGVNAYIAENANRLPIEFVLTGVRPEPWTIETMVLRQNVFGDATTELQLARSVARLGAAEANKRRNPDPWDELVVPDGLDIAALAEIGNDLETATRAGGQLPRPEIQPQFRSLLRPAPGLMDTGAVKEPGSNNWVVSGALSATGKPVVANDPHREVTNPSLRYIVHLNAPGWNVIGSSEPPFMGVAIGHNERVAWGLTIVGTDQHDVYVEEVNPANANEVKWNGQWEQLRVVREEIRVNGEQPRVVELKFSRHGPIFYEDAARHRAYALKSALHEPGTAPYLGSLRLAQARDCKQFLDEAMYWKSPSENLICGDVDGNISWQASALTPVRDGWVGRLPVPGTGKYEWKGFRQDLPRELNPASGFVATANHNINPKGYWPPLMFMAGDARFSRIARLRQLVEPGRKYTMADHQRMQNDAYSLQAGANLERFKGWTSTDAAVEKARAEIAAWDGVLGRDSRPAALYQAWVGAGVGGRRGQPPDAEPTREATEARLTAALRSLTTTQGADQSQWRWGRMHTRSFPHPFITEFDLATVERPGGAGSVAADGASYR
jgi:penicillin amidase